MPSLTEKRLVSPRALPWLFSITAFLGASLIFIVEPLAAKLLLPSFGGASTVWATSTLFFQVVLLLAYIMVHYSSKLGPKRQGLFIHGPLALIALVTLPLGIPGDVAGLESNPVFLVVRALVIMLGVPFVVLSTTGPLMQKWYSWSDGPRADDPYFIYAASNAGSFIGLLSYPFIIEPLLSLDNQRILWSVAFSLFLILMVSCWFMVAGKKVAAELKLQALQKLGCLRYAKWITLAFIPSSLMLGVTTHLTTDVASIPLLWVIPLSIYLATMIAAFGRKGREPIKGILEMSAVFSILAVALGIQGNQTTLLMASTSCFIALAFVSYSAHSYLAIDRPETAHLTKYFVAISFGGALGGLLNGFIAPTIFDGPLEFYLVFSLVPLMLLLKPGRTVLRTSLAAATSVVMLAGFFIADAYNSEGVIYKSRTFYGSYRVADMPDSKVFLHGTTIHGIQLKDPEKSNQALSYYSEVGPLGDIFAARGDEAKNVTVVGLGAGVMAAYTKPGQTWNFIEIDPEVISIAENPKYFTYLENAKSEVNLVAADGRKAISDLADKSQDIIVLDAFSSDSIPVHLLTREAIAEYQAKLAPGGIIVIHVSNRAFDLVPVVVSAGEHIKWSMLIGQQENADADNFPATWTMLTDDAELTEKLDDLESWKDLTGTVKPVVWTDDYSSVLKVLY